jgi:hypothetical protein
MLLHSDDPEREAVLGSVANDARESAQKRSLAAIALGHIRTSQAELLLKEIAQTAPPSVAADALRSLGRVGSSATIASIDAHVAADEPVAGAARYAAALIAHRFRLPTHDLPVPAATELPDVPSADRCPVDVDRTSEAEARAVLAALEDEPYGVELAPAPLTRLRCGTDTHVVCLNRELTALGAAATLLERKALLALVALRARERDGYSVSYVVLARPLAEGTVALLAPRCTGRPALAGSAAVSGERLHLTLRAIDRPGARPLAIDGTLELGVITITRAATGATRRPAPAPE